MGEIARGMFEVLAQDPRGLPLPELRERVYELVPPNRQERVHPDYYLGGWTTGLVKAEWIRKENRLWFATELGLLACKRYGDDPGQFAREWTRLYHVAMRRRRRSSRPSGTGAAARPTDQARYRAHPDRERRLASAAALGRFAVESTELFSAHRRQLLSLAVWFTTEVDGKYQVRYRSNGARALPRDRQRELRHEHVITRKQLADAMLNEPHRIAEILAGAVACIVTKEEHTRLNAVPDTVTGWDRYVAAGIDVYDEQDGTPFIQSGRFIGAIKPAPMAP